MELKYSYPNTSVSIDQRANDGYVHATALCTASGKKFNDYTRLASTQEFIAELSSETGIPASELIQTVKGGDVRSQGSWVHPQVAINLGQWASPKVENIYGILYPYIHVMSAPLRFISDLSYI